MATSEVLFLEDLCEATVKIAHLENLLGFPKQLMGWDLSRGHMGDIFPLMLSCLPLTVRIQLRGHQRIIAFVCVSSCPMLWTSVLTGFLSRPIFNSLKVAKRRGISD